MSETPPQQPPPPPPPRPPAQPAPPPPPGLRAPAPARPGEVRWAALTRIDPWSVGKVSGVLNAIMGFIIGVIYAFVFVIMAVVEQEPMMAVMGLAFLVGGAHRVRRPGPALRRPVRLALRHRGQLGGPRPLGDGVGVIG